MSSWRPTAPSPRLPLPGGAIPKFVDPLPTLVDLGAIVAGTSQIELQMKEFRAQSLPADTVPNYDGTWVWGYLRPGQTGRNTHLGPVIVATRGTPTEMKFVNNLGYSGTTKVLAYRYSTDQTLHWADPLNGEANHWGHMAMPPDPGTEGAENYYGPIPAVVHLHGGEVPPVPDGGPDAWFLNHAPDTVAYPHTLMHGHSFYSKDGAAATNYNIYRYPNRQEGAPIWFHDHTPGATRLNVYAGLAGGYVLLDPANDPANLLELVLLIIQDRMFDTYGQLFFPADSAGDEQWAPNPEHPYWVPEFVGDTILVNGKTWPFLNVQAKRYTFLFLNGSNARAYEMYLLNEVMGVAQTAINPVTGSPAEYPGGPREILVNNTKWNGKRVVGVTNGMYDMEPIAGFASDGFGNYPSEIPKEGETEVWEYVNLTADAHPMHTHLTQFQIMNRQAFDVEGYETVYAEAFPAGGYDPMTDQLYPDGVYIPSFGPPLDYNTPHGPHGGKSGGNPDVTPFLQGDVLPPVRSQRGRTWLRLALPHRRSRRQRDDAAVQGVTEQRCDANLRHGDGLLIAGRCLVMDGRRRFGRSLVCRCHIAREGGVIDRM